MMNLIIGNVMKMIAPHGRNGHLGVIVVPLVVEVLVQGKESASFPMVQLCLVINVTEAPRQKPNHAMKIDVLVNTNYVDTVVQI